MSPEPAPLTDLSFRSILVADDDRLMRRYLESQLAPLGCRILTSSTGLETLEIAQAVHPDLILLDVVMPGMDGFEVCQRLKADPATRDIVVIHLTGLGRDAKDRSFASGADDFLNKPPHFVELRSRLRSHLLIKSLQGSAFASEPEPAWAEEKRPARVLAVFSHDALRNHVADVLTEAGHRVKAVAAIQDALPLLGRTLPDLLVLDHHLQDGNGVTFTSSLRTFQRTVELPVLLVCARKNLEEEIKNPDPGPTDYLTKPFLPAELLLRVSVLLRQGGVFQGQDAARSPLGRHLLKDPATGLFTSGFLEAHLAHLLPQAARAGMPLSLLGARAAGEGEGEEALDQGKGLFRAVLQPGEPLCRVSDRTLVAVLAGVELAEAQARAQALAAAGFPGPVAAATSTREATPNLLLANLARELAQ